MKYILYLFLLFITINCNVNKKTIATDLNAIGEITKVKKCINCSDATYIYTVEISPTYSIKYKSLEYFKKGQQIYLQSSITIDE
jgi:hypothetical protein